MVTLTAWLDKRVHRCYSLSERTPIGWLQEESMGTSVQDVIHTILDQIPGAPREGTVDTVKAGDPAQPVTGIVTTFWPRRLCWNRRLSWAPT